MDELEAGLPAPAAGGAALAFPAREWCMKRNCSLSPRQALLVYALLSAATLGIALVFTLRGAWMVLAFALVESAAVGAALYYYARHALDRECLRLADGCLLVQRHDGVHSSELRLDPRHTRVTLADLGMRTLVVLEARGQRAEVGRFLVPAARLELAAQLRQALRPGSLLA